MATIKIDRTARLRRDLHVECLEPRIVLDARLVLNEFVASNVQGLHDEDGDRLVRLQGDPDHPITQGFLCHKVSKYPKRVYHKDRLLYPLRRGPNGFERISWQEAIEYAASELLRLKKRYGPWTLFTLKGHASTGSLKHLYDRFIALWGGASSASLDSSSIS